MIVKDLELIPQKYSVIVVDPPWPIKKIKRMVRPNQVNMDYPLMTLDEIKNLPVSQISMDNSVCFLWVINRFVKDGFDVLERWGFKYQRIITWDKGNGMSLFGFHHRTEFVLFGYKGHLEIYPKRRTMPTLIQEHTWRQHSVKPQLFYDYASLFGSPRIDLFARKERQNWDVWGNEL